MTLKTFVYLQIGPCFVQAKAKCVRDSLRKLQDVPKFLDSIKTAVSSVSSVVETIEEDCAEMDKTNESE